MNLIDHGSTEKTKALASKALASTSDYDELLSGISKLLETARRTAGRRVNSILTVTYWEIGRRIIQHE